MARAKKADVSQHSRQHTIYKNAAGVRLPGVTTLVGLRDKPALPPAANKLGLQGIDSVAHWKELAVIGRATHAMVYAELSGTKFDPQDYTPRQIDRAENGFIKFLDWLKGHKLEPIILEQPLVSERHQWGGTPDIYCRLDGRLELIDAKSGAGIWPEHWFQLAGYATILEEHGHKVEARRILNIGRDETEDFLEEVRVGQPKEDEVWILTCFREIWAAEARLRKEKD